MTDSSDRLRTALADRYVIERELGSGGMATVYLAQDVRHRRRVAVKVLRPELAASLGLERFVREIEIAANLNHPHILPLHDSGEAGGFLYYVMPFVEGESLRDRLTREKKLSVHDAVRLTEQVASALSYAHERGVIHRDIKPENILCTGNQAVVADFGIARAVEVAGRERLTGTGIAVGTPAYMSPEQAVGDTNIDARSDVYALGCVVYEMVSGRTPFEGATPQALLAKHATDTAPSLRSIDPDVPLYVERAVSQALAKDPARRFKTPNEFAATLTSQTVVPQIGKRRLAVLPPIDLMNDPEQEYFVHGMHNALISELQRAGVAVIARTSVLQYENTQKPVRQIAGELGVDALVEPSVFRTADSVELEVRLVDGKTEEYLADPIARNGELGNVVALYRDLSRAIAGEIHAVLTPQTEARLASARPVNPQAYEAYLKGQFHAGKLTPPDLETALHYYELALTKEPQYALAHAGIALLWAFRQQMGIVPPSEAAPQARDAVARALELDADLVEVQYALAIVRTWTDWDWEASEAAYHRAIELNPNFPDVRAYYSHFLSMMKRHNEAIVQMERALELDPFNALFLSLYGVVLQIVGRNDDAVAQFQNALRTVPNHPVALQNLWIAFHRMGMYEKALAEAKAFYAAVGAIELEGALARGYAQGGYRGAMSLAADTLAEISRSVYVMPLNIMLLYTFAGRDDQAFAWLERGVEERDPNSVYLGVAADFDSLRDDPRCQDLLRRMNLPPG